MKNYSVSKHCSPCASREAEILQEESKPVGDVWSVLLQAALVRRGVAQQRPRNSPVCFILYLLPTTTLNKQPTLFYCFPLASILSAISILGNFSLSQHSPVTVFENLHPQGVPHAPCSHLLSSSSSCYCTASLALAWPTTFPFPHVQYRQFPLPVSPCHGCTVRAAAAAEWEDTVSKHFLFLSCATHFTIMFFTYLSFIRAEKSWPI